MSARPRHRNSRITAESLRGKPSSPREAPSTRPCSAKKSGAAMTGGTLCRLGGEVADVGHFLPLFTRLGVNRGRGGFLAELCSLPSGRYFVHPGRLPNTSMRFPVTARAALLTPP